MSLSIAAMIGISGIFSSFERCFCSLHWPSESEDGYFLLSLISESIIVVIPYVVFYFLFDVLVINNTNFAKIDFKCYYIHSVRRIVSPFNLYYWKFFITTYNFMSGGLVQM